MSDAKGQPEPSMEEILASIRRIIAEDGDAAGPPSAAGVTPAKPAAPAPRHDDILELTEVLEEDGTVVRITPGAKKKAAPAAAEPVVEKTAPKLREPEPLPPAPAVPAAAEPRPLAAALPESPPHPEPMPAQDEPLVSSAAAAASMAALSQLADLGQHGTVSTRPFDDSGRTLESLVRELLRPMLRDWLDVNLAPLVERLVREEIQRLRRDGKAR